MKLLRSRRILQKTSLRNTDGCVLWTLLRRPRRRSVRPRLLLMVQSSIHQRTLFYLRHIPLLLFLLLNLTVNLPIVSWLWGRGLVPCWLTRRRGRAASSCWRLGAGVMRGVWLGHGDLCRLQTSKGSWNVWRSRKEMRCLTSILTCFPVRIPFFDAPAWRTCCWCYIYIYVYICINRGPPSYIWVTALFQTHEYLLHECFNHSNVTSSPLHLCMATTLVIITRMTNAVVPATTYTYIHRSSDGGGLKVKVSSSREQGGFSAWLQMFSCVGASVFSLLVSVSCRSSAEENKFNHRWREGWTAWY